MARKPKVLIVDDDPDVRTVIREVLGDRHVVVEAEDAETALRVVEREDPDVLLLDLNLGTGPDGFTVLDQVRTMDPALPVVVLSQYSDTERIVRAMRAGAAHYVDKTPNRGVLVERLRIALDERRRSFAAETHRLPEGFEIVGESSVMRGVFQLARAAAENDLPVLILGETGTGKSMLARSIHRWSGRRKRAYRDVNVAGLPATVLDSELFGHERGAFTGAERRRRGLFELASGGSLLLDEIGDLPRESQIKLLKVVEEQCVRRIGGEHDVPIDTRILAATHQDLPTMIRRGTFRADLFHRLAGAIIRIPPLRERPEDIAPLAQSFLDRGMRLGDGAVELLRGMCWPGNVRELQQTLRRAALIANQESIGTEHLRLAVDAAGLDESADGHGADVFDLSYDEACNNVLDRFRRRYIAKVLERCEGNVTEAARTCGLSRGHLHALINKLGLLH